jgi:hypothetical protein
MSYQPTGATTVVGEALKAAAQAVSDPYLPQVACEVQRLGRIERGQKPGPRCSKPARVTPGVGIGLESVVMPIRAFSFYKQYPWAVIGGTALAFALVYSMGYSAGRGQ